MLTQSRKRATPLGTGRTEIPVRCLIEHCVPASERKLQYDGLDHLNRDTAITKPRFQMRNHTRVIPEAYRATKALQAALLVAVSMHFQTIHVQEYLPAHVAG